MTDPYNYQALGKVLGVSPDTPGGEIRERLRQSLPSGWTPTAITNHASSFRVAYRSLDGKNPRKAIHLYLAPQGWVVSSLRWNSLPFSQYNAIHWGATPQEAYAIWALKEATR